MKLKKIAAVTMTIVNTVLFSLNGFAENVVYETNPCKMGYIPDSIEEFNESTNMPRTYSSIQTTLPSSVDLSDSVYFPPIGDQGYLGSCASFATTYYQFTYEVNKMNGITNKESMVIYSPKWTYNLVNRGYDGGSNFSDNYAVLMKLGGLNISDCPYTGSFFDYQSIPSQMKEEKLEALETRISSWGSNYIMNDAQIDSPDAMELNSIKEMLYQNKILVASTYCNFNSKIVNNDCVAYRCSENPDGSHAVTIVGYDDNISCDVNGNGIIEDCEKGAFKVANSWGKSYNSYGISSTESNANPGYFWVLYDALNYISTNNLNDWENSLSGTRCSAFSLEAENGVRNMFYYINVKHKDVNLVGELDLSTTDREGIKLKIGRTDQSVTTWPTTSNNIIFPYDGSYGKDENGNDINNISFDGIILFDYDSLSSPISNYVNQYNWHVNLSNKVQLNTNASFKILDNNGNSITDYKNLIGNQNSISAYHSLSLQKGDVDYDGIITSADANIVMNYVAMISSLSNLQYELADYNNDGSVDIADVVGINMNLL